MLKTTNPLKFQTRLSQLNKSEILKEVKYKTEKSTENVSFKNERTKALKMIRTQRCVLIQFLESLILAQDERWRRA